MTLQKAHRLSEIFNSVVGKGLEKDNFSEEKEKSSHNGTQVSKNLKLLIVTDKYGKTYT